MVKIQEQSPQKTKTHSSKLVKPIIPLAKPENSELDASDYIDHTCHNTSRDTTSEKQVIKIPSFDFDTPEEQITFVDLVQSSHVGQNVTTGPPMNKHIERVLNSDVKVELLQIADLVGSHTITNFTTVMVPMTLHVFPNYCHTQVQVLC